MNHNNEMSAAQLTRRETEILKYLAEGQTSQLIGKALSISKGTVDKHRKNMLKKTGTRNSMELVQSCLKKFL